MAESSTMAVPPSYACCSRAGVGVKDHRGRIVRSVVSAPGVRLRFESRRLATRRCSAALT